MAEQSFRSLYDFFKLAPYDNFILEDVEAFTTGNLYFPGQKQAISAYGSNRYANRLFYADSIANGTEGTIRVVAKGVLRNPLGVGQQVEIRSPVVQVTIKPLLYLLQRSNDPFGATNGKSFGIDDPFNFFVSNYVRVQSLKVETTGGVSIFDKGDSTVVFREQYASLQLHAIPFRATSDGTITVTIQVLGPADPSGKSTLIEKTATVKVRVATPLAPKALEPTTAPAGSPAPQAVPPAPAGGNSPNQAPAVTPGQVSVAAGGSVDVPLVGADPEGAALTFSVTRFPAHGTLSGQAPGLVYRPDAGFSGTDALAFTASDGAATSAEATVIINVTQPSSPPTTSKRATPKTKKKASTPRR